MKLGIHDNISIEDYHADRQIISSTGLKEAKKSSRHFAYYLTYGIGDKPAFNFGNAFELHLLDEINGTLHFGDHCILYDPDQRIEQEKGITSKKNQEWKASIYNSGKYVVKKDGDESWETIRRMTESVLAEPIISNLLTRVDYQKSFVWEDECGALCKTRPDLSMVNKNVIVDIKTTKDASPEGFARECANYDYPLQAFMQIEGVVKTGYMPKVDVYYWLAVEKTAPYNAVLYRFQDEDIEWIGLQYGRYLRRAYQVICDYAEANGDFHKIKGYSENALNKYGIVDIELPLYYRNKI